MTMSSLQLSTASRRFSAAWPQFTKQLSAVLKRLREDQFLVISEKRSHRFVQFAGQGSYGLRAEVVSNAYLSPEEQFDQDQLAALGRLGWQAPTGIPEQSSTPERDPDGSPNFFVDYPKPVPYSDVADMAVRTLAEVMLVPHPGMLEYNSFDRGGGALRWPKLGLRHESQAQSSPDLAQQVLEAVRKESGIADVEYDKDGDIGLRFGSVLVWVRLSGAPKHVLIHSALVNSVEESPALLARLNAMNAGMTHMHLFLRGDRIIAVADVQAEPFQPTHLAKALREFCQLADGMDDLLQAEFGGQSAFPQPAPSAVRH
jgi:hypothetical protein